MKQVNTLGKLTNDKTVAVAMNKCNRHLNIYNFKAKKKNDMNAGE